jgi:hypothetical protein
MESLPFGGEGHFQEDLCINELFVFVKESERVVKERIGLLDEVIKGKSGCSKEVIRDSVFIKYF